MPGTNTMKHILDAARSGDLATALAAGTIATDTMSVTSDTDAYLDAAAALGAAFDTIKAAILASDPALPDAVAAHAARLSDRSPRHNCTAPFAPCHHPSHGYDW